MTGPSLTALAMNEITSWEGYPLYVAMRVNNKGHSLFGAYGSLKLYKSARTARTFAGSFDLAHDHTIVLRLDLMYLPVVAEDTDPRAEGVKMTELEFCERQMQLWGERARAAEIEATSDKAYALSLEHEERRRQRRADMKERRRLRRLAEQQQP